MKKLLILTVTAVMILTACNQEEVLLDKTQTGTEDNSVNQGNPYRVSLDQALGTADILLNQLDDASTRSVSQRRIKDVQYITEHQTRSDVTDTLLYIVNYDDDMGFAILGTDVRSMPVYCISNEGQLNLADTVKNKGLASLYNYYKYDAQVAGWGLIPFPTDSLDNPFPWYDPTPSKPDFGERKVTYYKQIKPKLSRYASRWDQGDPYNYFCNQGDVPGVTLNHVVGCTPLACAQIMSYYKWPVSYNGITLNWDEILSWPENMYSLNCPNSLALFLKEVGETLNSKPEEGVTYTYLNELIGNFHKFGYNYLGAGNLLNHTDGSAALEKGPILIWSAMENSNSGHTWVMDGYLSYKVEWDAIADPSKTLSYFMFHCVWGWGGYNNGYFSCPNGQSTGTIPDEYDESDMKENLSSVSKYKFINLRYFDNFVPKK